MGLCFGAGFSSRKTDHYCSAQRKASRDVAISVQNKRDQIEAVVALPIGIQPIPL